MSAGSVGRAERRDGASMNLDRHPWLALLGWFPPVWFAGVIRTWGQPEYEIGVDVWILEATVSACLWWPLNLYNRKRRTA